MTNKELIQKIENFLKTTPRAVVAISLNKKYLTQKNEYDKKRRYHFNLEEVTEQYGSVEKMIERAIDTGLYKGTISLKKRYTKTLLPVDEIPFILEDFEQEKEEEMNNEQNNLKSVNYPAPAFNNVNASYMGMGYSTIANGNLLDLQLKKERYGELERNYDDLKQKYKDVKSENRTLKETNANLKNELKLSEKQYELKLREELLNKKSILENESLLNTIQMGMGYFMGINKKAPSLTPALGMGVSLENLSPNKQALMQVIPNLDDSVINKIIGLIQNEMMPQQQGQDAQDPTQ